LSEGVVGRSVSRKGDALKFSYHLSCPETEQAKQSKADRREANSSSPKIVVASVWWGIAPRDDP